MHAFVRDWSEPQTERLKTREPCDMYESRISDPGIGQVEPAQVSEPLQTSQLLVERFLVAARQKNSRNECVSGH